jgi:acyl-CoA reductase-like NAD-dependent aldehyde dehydrogenase
MSQMIQYNPATGAVVAHIEEATPADVGAAMERARAAFPAWRDTPLAARLQWMKKLREHIVDHAEAISNRIAEATGKIASEALITEVYIVADALHYYEKTAPRALAAKKAKTPLIFFGNRSWVHYQPMGVVGVIAPWNFPFQLSVVPVISALVAGNTMLLKPSEVTPDIGVLIEEVFAAIDFPRDVFQVLHGGRETGAALVDSRPDKIFFTGSVATGSKIMAAAAQHLIPCDLELGGKDPMLVFADSHLERAANAAVWGAFVNAGQVCMSVERVYVERTVYAEFLEKVLAKTRALRIGEDVGSMTFAPQLDLVEAHLQDALERGAQIELGGKRLREDTLHFAPTVLTNVDHSMRIMREETFGPVLPIMAFDSEEEAITLANDSDYGLNASVWSSNAQRAKRVAERLVSGNVCINEVISTIGNPHLPFGGVKHSGIGRYHAPVGLTTFAHQTSIMASPGKKRREVNWFPYTPEQELALYTTVDLFAGRRSRVTLKGVLALLRQFMGGSDGTASVKKSPGSTSQNANKNQNLPL